MALTAQQFEAQMPGAQLLLSDEPGRESSLQALKAIAAVLIFTSRKENTVSRN